MIRYLKLLSLNGNDGFHGFNGNMNFIYSKFCWLSQSNETQFSPI